MVTYSTTYKNAVTFTYNPGTDACDPFEKFLVSVIQPYYNFYNIKLPYP